MRGFFSLGPCSILSYHGKNAYITRPISEGEKEDLREYRNLVAQGVDVSKDGNAIKDATLKEYLAVVRYLVSQGADVRVDNNYAISVASENGNLGLVKYLHSHGADIRSNEDYPVRAASQEGHLDVVKYLVSKGADIRSGDDYPIDGAGAYGHLDVVKYLVSKGADVTKIDMASVEKAVKFGRFKMLRYLVVHGAILNSEEKRYRHDIQTAIANNNLEIVKYLVAQGVNITVDLEECMAISKKRCGRGVTETILFLKLPDRLKKAKASSFLRCVYTSEFIRRI